jgi:hypothetical protein
MAATVRRKYKITIKLTNNDEDDEEEFIIDNMRQILLQNFAELSNGIPDDLTDNSYIYMLKDNYYIDNDVIKNIKGSKVDKLKYTFKDFGSKGTISIINEFYMPILNYSDTTIKIAVLKQILKNALSSLELAQFISGKKLKEDQQEKKDRNKKIEEIKKKKNEIENLKEANKEEVQIYIDEFKDILNILAEKEVLSTIKSNYENNDDKSLNEFRKNLTNIMLNINSDPNINIELNKVETYRYFLNTDYIEAIFEAIQNNILYVKKLQQTNNGSYSRTNLLNTPETQKQIIKENMKYVYPDKTNVEALGESEEEDILLFHNILYIVKKIYLLDTTIISVITSDNTKNVTKKFYIKNLTLEQKNPFKIDKIKNKSKDNEYYNVFINFRCDIKYINENPLLKINYIIDDKEILDKTNHLKIIEFDPKNFNKNQEFKKYNSTYIYDTFDYESNDSKINRIINTIKIQKIIKTKEEIFFNNIVLNELNELLDIDFSKDDIKEKYSSSNILYFLKNIMELYNGKEITQANDTYFVYDTLITNNISKIDSTNISNSILKFYSISKNNSITYNNFKAEKIKRNLFKKFQLLQLENITPYDKDNFEVFKLESRDNRIKRNTYYIFILFLCYKADEKGNKPSFQKRIIGEVCLERAKILDNAFYNLFYSKLNIPETFLYNKLLNLQKSKQSTTVKNKEIPQAKELPPNLETLETKIKGGKKKYTRKIKLTS